MKKVYSAPSKFTHFYLGIGGLEATVKMIKQIKKKRNEVFNCNVFFLSSACPPCSDKTKSIMEVFNDVNLGFDLLVSEFIQREC